MGTDRVDRDPDAALRTRRALDKISTIFNDLIAADDIIKDSSGRWRVNPVLLTNTVRQASFFGGGGDDDEGPMGMMGLAGPQGTTGATGATGPAGSGGGGMSVGFPGEDGEDGASGLFGGGSQILSVSEGVASRIGWTYHADQLADEQVENSSTLVDSTTLQVGLTAGVYEFVLVILYSGNNASVDFKFDLAVTAGNLNGYFQHVGDNTTADAVLSSQIRVTAGTSWAAPISAGTDASDTVRYVTIRGIHTFTADCTVKVRHANVTPALGRISTLRSGSYIRLRKVR